MNIMQIWEQKIAEKGADTGLFADSGWCACPPPPPSSEFLFYHVC